MANVKFGEVDWNSGDVPTGGTGGRSDFMKLKEGTTVVRVMGNPVQFYNHWVETDGKKRPFNSPVDDPKLVKQLEDAGFKRKVGWIIKVLDRADGQFKLLEIGSQIYKGIKALVADKEWGPVTGYDIKILRGSPGTQPLYSVVPKPHQPLESSYKEAFTKFNDRVDLAKLTQPADPAAVREYLGWRDESAASKPAPKQSTSSEDDFFNFGD